MVVFSGSGCLLGEQLHQPQADPKPDASELPPPYALQLLPSLPSDTSYTHFAPSAVQIKLEKTHFVSGEVITGHVLFSPRSILVDPILKLEVVCLEQARDVGGLMNKDKVSVRKRILAKSTLPLCGSIAPMQQSSVPFALDMNANNAEMLCDCPELSSGTKSPCKHHCAFPPSIGYSGDVHDSFVGFVAHYMVRVRVTNSQLRADRTFWYTPIESVMDISEFQNAQGEPLASGATVIEKLARRKRLVLKPVLGSLTARASPIYQAISITHNGVAHISLEYMPESVFTSAEPAAAFTVKSVTGKVIRRWYSSTRGIGNILDKTETTKTTAYKLPSSDIVTDFNLLAKMVPNQWVLKVWYKIPPLSVLNLPSFASCMGALTYEVHLKIKHTFGLITISVPLVLQVGGLPSYCSLNSTISEVPSVPSLISDH